MTRSLLFPPDWNVPQVFLDELGTRLGRQRAIEAEGHLLIVLHAPPDPEEAKRKGRFFWRAPDGKWLSTFRGAGIASLKNHVKDYAAAVESLDRQTDAARTLEEEFATIHAFSPLVRATRHLHETLQAAARQCQQDAELTDLRDRDYEVERTAELAYQEARNRLDFTIARQAQEHAEHGHQMAVAAHRLNLLVAMFFPLATIATLFGMNVHFGFDTEASPLVLVAILVVGAICGVILTGFVTGPSGRTQANGKTPFDAKHEDST